VHRTALPGGDLVAATSSDGTLRVFTTATRVVVYELFAPASSAGWRPLSAMGGDIIASGRLDDRRVVT
jgi:hypothetical protein